MGAPVRRVGYPPWGARVISTLEILALFGLWSRTLALTALAILVTTLTGAAATWLIHGPRAAAAYPGTILVLVALLVAWELRRTDLTASGVQRRYQ
jgi:hypothetical protein